MMNFLTCQICIQSFTFPTKLTGAYTLVIMITSPESIEEATMDRVEQEDTQLVTPCHVTQKKLT
jgi:hypothetical protein